MLALFRAAPPGYSLNFPGFDVFSSTFWFICPSRSIWAAPIKNIVGCGVSGELGMVSRCHGIQWRIKVIIGSYANFGFSRRCDVIKTKKFGAPQKFALDFLKIKSNHK